jgi:hypothetical protein
MKIFRFSALLLSLLALYTFSACDDEDGLPNPLRFEVASATFEGSPLSPAPTGYSISVSYTDTGNLTGFTATGSELTTPTPGNSGSLSLADGTVTFTSGGTSRTSVISAGSLAQNSTTVTLTFSLTKTDGASAEQVGTYVYVMNVAR